MFQMLQQPFYILMRLNVLQGGDVTAAELAEAGWNRWLATSAAVLVCFMPVYSILGG